MTELWLLRHGQTDWNLERRFQGHRDIPLNAAGLEQAQSIARSLNGHTFAALYSSDLQRALQTAQVVSLRLGLPVQIDLRLREISHGEWEGMLVEEVNQMYSPQQHARLHDAIHSRAPGGESVAEVAHRMASAADDFAARYPGQRVLVVSHGLALATLICMVNGLSLAKAHEMVPDNASPTVIRWGD